MSSHELQNTMMLSVEFSKIYYTRYTVPTLSLEQQIPVLETVCNISFLSTILELYIEIALISETVWNRSHVYKFMLRMTDSRILTFPPGTLCIQTAKG
jgi:hypothetical protein